MISSPLGREEDEELRNIEMHVNSSLSTSPEKMAATVFDLLKPYIEPNVLRNIILEYSLPISLHSFGISFSTVRYLPEYSSSHSIVSKGTQPSNPVTLRQYLEVTSFTDKETGRRGAVTDDIMRCIYRRLSEMKLLRYYTQKDAFAIHGDIFIIDSSIDDPAYTFIWEDAPDNHTLCPLCKGKVVIGVENCMSCLGMGIDIDTSSVAGRGAREICIKQRSMKENLVLDEKIQSSIFTAHVEYDFTLTCIYSAFHSGTSEEAIKDFNTWEREVRSLKKVR